jgi:uncharacterized protein (TIGR00725 family)
MKLKIGVMGSAGAPAEGVGDVLRAKADLLGRAIAARDVVLLTGGTTGVVYAVGKAGHDAGAFHVGVSPASNEREHVDHYKLPTDACDVLIYTGFGLKGRNVVLVRSCDVVLFIAGAMGSLNEFTIAHDEGKVIGCLTETGGVADEAEYLLQKFSKPTGAQVLLNTEPDQLLTACLDAIYQ